MKRGAHGLGLIDLFNRYYQFLSGLLMGFGLAILIFGRP